MTNGVKSKATCVKVGIMTMYRIANYGSVFQAYALMTYIKKMGYDCTLINYLFPNNYHKKVQRYSVIKTTLVRIYHFLIGNPYKKKRKRFEDFYRHYLCETTRQYKSPNELKLTNKLFDVFVTGSDQVWNYSKVGKDESFMLGFVDDGKKMVSYSSSFSHDYIPEKYAHIYIKCLSRYAHISVREKSGLKIVKELIGKDAECTLDPTFLLGRDEYDKIAVFHEVKINKPFILVYILSYAYNPYPYIEAVIEHLHVQTGLDVVAVGLSNKSLRNKSWLKRYLYASPSDFLYLYSKADGVITTSFHGTVFSMIYEKPFISVIPSVTNDNRISNVLSLFNMTDHILKIGDVLENCCFKNFVKPANWEQLINQSKLYLKNSLQ